MADTSYATVAELRAQPGMTGSGSDTVIQAILNAAANLIDNFCNRPDGFVADSEASARYFPGSGRDCQWIDECAEVTAVAVKDSVSDDEDSYTAWTVGTVGSTTEADVFPATGDPRYPEFGRTPYTMLVLGANGDYGEFPGGRLVGRRGFSRSRSRGRGLPVVKVTARWGYASTVPAVVKQATITQASIWFKRGESFWAQTAGSAEAGTLRYLGGLDKDVELMLVSGRMVKPVTGRR